MKIKEFLNEEKKLVHVPYVYTDRFAQNGFGSNDLHFKTKEEAEAHIEKHGQYTNSKGKKGWVETRHIDHNNHTVSESEDLDEAVHPAKAHEILSKCGGTDKDFFQLHSTHVHDLLQHAKEHGYRKSKNAPGSTARMFHQHLVRQNAKYEKDHG